MPPGGATLPGRHRRRPAGRRPAQIGQHSGDLAWPDGANSLADNLADVRAQINQIAPSLQNLVDALSTLRVQYGGDALVRDVDAAAKLVDSINVLSNAMGVNFTAVKDKFA